MNFLENIFDALENIWSNKLRSTLSMLGIIIWVSSVIIMIAVGQGAENAVLSRIWEMWTNILTVSPWSQSSTSVYARSFGKSASSGNEGILEMEMVDIIKNIEGVKYVSPSVTGRKQAIYGKNNTNASINGIIPEYLDSSNTELDYGVFISENHIENMEQVAVIGATIVETLFEWANPIWQDIVLQNKIYTVIGVLKEKNRWTDEWVYIPISTAQIRLLGDKYLWLIDVNVENSNEIDKVKSEIEMKLMAYQGITNTEDINFTVSSQTDMLETISSVTDTFKILLWWIAAISLVVGWIWVMNIMLVSVMERTREIWIRKAIWAQNGNILFQFLTESIFVCLLWWLIGIGISFWVVNLMWNFGLNAEIASSSIVLSFWCSIWIWLFFWILPAYNAAKLKPIDALRFE